MFEVECVWSRGDVTSYTFEHYHAAYMFAEDQKDRGAYVTVYEN